MNKVSHPRQGVNYSRELLLSEVTLRIRIRLSSSIPNLRKATNRFCYKSLRNEVFRSRSFDFLTRELMILG